MSETLSILPISFWVTVALLVGGGIWAFRHMNDGTGVPVLAVLGTVTAWYVGDAFYNDYANNHAKLFDAGTLAGAWWQVAWFLLVFLALVRPIHQQMNRQQLGHKSGIMHMFKFGVDQPALQRQLNALFTTCVIVWVILFVIACAILKTEVTHYLLPIGYKVSPWMHGRVGAGFDFLSIIAIYLNLLDASIFGVVAALATNKRVRWMALGLCALTWPYFIIDRTRNTMLAVVIPAILCWIFLRLRWAVWKKVLLLLGCFIVVNTWMKFVIANRSDMNITTALSQKGFNFSDQKDVHNEGLNMFEELCWISVFIDNGSYHINWGQRYFAELVNPIPRAFWPGKPFIGLDYAKARGHASADDTQGGVNTTISTGLIGQGVVNFGRIGGPLAAAILMSLWVATLARLDLNIQAIGRLPLYSLGLILTFNMGRDVTLLVLYPFAFGAGIIWLIDHYHPQTVSNAALTAQASAKSQPAINSSGTSTRFVRRAASGGFARKSVSPKDHSGGLNHKFKAL